MSRLGIHRGPSNDTLHVSQLKPIGYWRNPDDPRTAHLPDPHDHVDPTWDPAERRRVVRYVRRGRVLRSLQGYSWCRFHCGIPDAHTGSADLTDGVYVWPQGYWHYLKAHGVRPPADFLAHVRASCRASPLGRLSYWFRSLRHRGGAVFSTLF